MTKAVNSIAVIGAGTMGSGIAQTAVKSGIKVLVVEQSDEKAEQGLGRIKSGIDRWVSRNVLSAEEGEQALSRLRFTTELKEIAESDLVVEAVFEDVELKQRILGDIDRIIPADTPIASNTSTIPLVILAAATSRPTRVVGLHFFNPVPLMRLVEVIRTPITDPDLVEMAVDMAKRMGKDPVVINDVPGFIGNLLVVPFLLDAIRAYERGVAGMEAIDEVIKLGFNHPMGPFALSDLIGLDIVHDMAASMYEEYQDPKYWPPTMLKQYVRMGRLGRKTGQGFYSYS